MRVLNPQYDDQLRNSVYPFLGNELVTTTDGYQIPNDAFLDASLLVPLETESVTLHAIEVTVSATLVLIFNTPDGELGRATVGPADDGAIPVIDSTGEGVGMVRCSAGPLGALRAWPVGTKYVDRRILPHLLVATPGSARRAIQLPDGTILRGAVYLVGGPGVVIDYDPSTQGARVNIVGDPYNRRTRPLRWIREINGIAVDNFIITSAPSVGGQPSYRLKIEPTSTGLKMSLVGTATGGVPV